jgi:hypothetical protein
VLFQISAELFTSFPCAGFIKSAPVELVRDNVEVVDKQGIDFRKVVNSVDTGCFGGDGWTVPCAELPDVAACPARNDGGIDIETQVTQRVL